MAAHTAGQPISADLRRIAPVLLLVIFTAISIALAMRVVARRHIERAMAANPNACGYADVFSAAARKRLTKLRIDIAEDRAKTDAALQQSTMGLAKGNPELEKARRELLRARTLCGLKPEHDYYLAIAEWYAGNPSQAHVFLGSYYLKLDNPDAAIFQYQAALQDDPQNTEATLGLAFTYQRHLRQERVEELIQGREAELSAEPWGKLMLGRIYAARGRHQEAIPLLEAGLLAYPAENPAIYEYAGAVTTAGEEKRGADFLYRLDEDGRQTLHSAFQESARLYRAANMLPEEEKALRKAVALASNSAELNYLLSVVLHRQGKKNEAQDYIRLALENSYERTMELIRESGVDPRGAAKP